MAQPTGLPNATITISIYGSGVPGLITFTLESSGAANLNAQEIVYILEKAAEQVGDNPEDYVEI